MNKLMQILALVIIVMPVTAYSGSGNYLVIQWSADVDPDEPDNRLRYRTDQGDDKETAITQYLESAVQGSTLTIRMTDSRPGQAKDTQVVSLGGMRELIPHHFKTKSVPNANWWGPSEATYTQHNYPIWVEPFNKLVIIDAPPVLAINERTIEAGDSVNITPGSWSSGSAFETGEHFISSYVPDTPVISLPDGTFVSLCRRSITHESVDEDGNLNWQGETGSLSLCRDSFESPAGSKPIFGSADQSHLVDPGGFPLGHGFSTYLGKPWDSVWHPKADYIVRD